MTNQELDELMIELDILIKASEQCVQRLEELDIRIQEIQKEVKLEINLYKARF